MQQDFKANDLELIKKIKEHIDNSSGASKLITVADLLNLFPIRKRLFTQLFKKEYASSPSDYSACARMELALEQLTKELKIREVSENLGYNAPETFSRAFKSYHGFLPSDVAIRQLT